MAAYASLVSLTHIIHDIQHHHSPPISIDIHQAQSLTQIIASLQEFLESHNSSSATEIDEADPLEMRIADAAYKAEDIIESHIVNRILPAAGSHHRTNATVRLPEDIDDETNLYEDMRRLIEKMESIKKEINAEKAVVHDEPEKAVVHDASFFTRQKSITAFSDDVIEEVMEQLATGKLSRQIIPITGMPGIGKTTLAKDIYEKTLIVEHFQIRAWATISQQYNTTEILCELLCQVSNRKREELSEKREDKLGEDLRKKLFGRRYLIVMDDMWNIEVWDSIKWFFPDNQNGSRVLVTTRLKELSSQLNETYIHHMKFLDKDSSWDLFSKTVFGELKSCPSELEGIGKKIVENCRGLPLSIVVVGGIVKNMKSTRGNWESIGNSLTSVVNSDHDKHCLRLLRLSYSHLPAYLKPCFLYMGVFEEDSEIKVSMLIKLWISEGFIKPMNDENLKAIGKGLLEDLVDRNLILVHERGSTGNIKYCKIHDLLRDLCLSEGKKDGFYHVIGQENPRGTYRRVVIPRNTSKKKVLKDLKSRSHVRSIVSEYGKVPYYKNFKLVRALHAYKFRYYNEESYVNSHAFQYVNLRHLAVEVNETSMSSFFSSLSLYWNLHSLIVSSTHDSTAPVDIWKMPQFRRIEFVNMRLFLPNPPSDAVVMENLQVLRVIENFKFSEEAVERIPNIKKLGLRYSGVEGFLDLDGDYYCLGNIEKLHKLESLNVAAWRDFMWPHSLSKLTFPHSLKKLNLSMIPYFEYNDILEKIGSLPLLEKLKLWSGGFREGEWEVAEGQFPRLKYLGIFACSPFKKLTARDESFSIFPCLEELFLVYLKELEEIPFEIGTITTLQKISMQACNVEVAKRAKEIVEEQIELQGDDLPFDVMVGLLEKNEELESLDIPNFRVYAHNSDDEAVHVSDPPKEVGGKGKGSLGADSDSVSVKMATMSNRVLAHLRRQYIRVTEVIARNIAERAEIAALLMEFEDGPLDLDEERGQSGAKDQDGHEIVSDSEDDDDEDEKKKDEFYKLLLIKSLINSSGKM